MKKEWVNLRKPSMTSSEHLKNLGVAAKEEEERAEKQRKKKFDDEMKLEKAKLEQKLKYEKKIDWKKIKSSTPSCQNWLLQSSKASPPTGCGFETSLRQKFTQQTFHRFRSSPNSRIVYRLQQKATNERKIY